MNASAPGGSTLPTFPDRFNLAHYLLDARIEEGSGDRPAVHEGDVTFTYSEVRSLANRAAPALRGMGFDVPVEPHGAFYLYAGSRRLTDDSFAFCFDLLEKTGVAITPGKDFGRYRAEEHVRFAYTTAMDRLEEGVERLGKYLNVG